MISAGETLDGGTISNLTFCEQGLNDAGQVAFIASLDPTTGFNPRSAVFVATPVTSGAAR